jgi:hypothetical protein
VVSRGTGRLEAAAWVEAYGSLLTSSLEMVKSASIYKNKDVDYTRESYVNTSHCHTIS